MVVLEEEVEHGVRAVMLNGPASQSSYPMQQNIVLRRKVSKLCVAQSGYLFTQNMRGKRL